MHPPSRSRQHVQVSYRTELDTLSRVGNLQVTASQSNQILQTLKPSAPDQSNEISGAASQRHLSFVARGHGQGPVPIEIVQG